MSLGYVILKDCSPALHRTPWKGTKTFGTPCGRGASVAILRNVVLKDTPLRYVILKDQGRAESSGGGVIAAVELHVVRIPISVVILVEVQAELRRAGQVDLWIACTEQGGSIPVTDRRRADRSPPARLKRCPHDRQAPA